MSKCDTESLAFAYFFVDLLFPLADKRNQTVHDKLTHTTMITTYEDSVVTT